MKVYSDPALQRPIKLWGEDEDEKTMQQLRDLARLPFIHKNGVASMPDRHWGNGTSVGTVIATQRAIIPAAVGVDIGCGMNAVMTSLKASDLPDSLAEIRHSIEAAIPLGAGGARKEGGWGGGIESPPECVVHALFKGDPYKAAIKWGSQLGTLGSGNHFIEVCLDTEQNVWVMLHSGSRGIGNMIGVHYISAAKELMERFHITLPDPALAYLPQGEKLFDEYIQAMSWAQDYAACNREIMMGDTLAVLQKHLGVFKLSYWAINCHHNYATMESHFGENLWITRKGAVSARAGQLGIIPGSMGQRSYIVRGKGNPQSYHSCSHGAGRVMSRSEANKRFTVEDLKAQTMGVECRKDAAVIDEIPASYKDIDAVMAAQSDLVEIVHTLKQVLCVKGA